MEEERLPKEAFRWNSPGRKKINDPKRHARRRKTL